jgi:hypothetical protein
VASPTPPDLDLYRTHGKDCSLNCEWRELGKARDWNALMGGSTSPELAGDRPSTPALELPPVPLGIADHCGESFSDVRGKQLRPHHARARDPFGTTTMTGPPAHGGFSHSGMRRIQIDRQTRMKSGHLSCKIGRRIVVGQSSTPCEIEFARMPPDGRLSATGLRATLVPARKRASAMIRIMLKRRHEPKLRGSGV